MKEEEGLQLTRRKRENGINKSCCGHYNELGRRVCQFYFVKLTLAMKIQCMSNKMSNKIRILRLENNAEKDRLERF